MCPHPLDHIPILEAAERFKLSSSEVEARSIDPLCYAAAFFTTLVRDAGIEPASSRLKGECISISANPAQNLVGDAGIEPALSRLRVECICHLCQSPLVQEERIELSPRDYRSRARPSSYSCNCWCAVRELNPHLLGVGQLFWSVELPAQNLVEGTGVEPVWPR